MLVVILVNVHRVRGDGWEDRLSMATHNASARFAVPEDRGTAAVHVSLTFLGAVDQGQSRANEDDREGSLEDPESANCVTPST